MQENLYLWHKAPFLRLLPNLAAGIMIQHLLDLDLVVSAGLFLLSFIWLLSFSLLHIRLRFILRPINGLMTGLLMISLGALLVYLNDVRKDPLKMEGINEKFPFFLLTIEEQPTEKPNSWKTIAGVLIPDNGKWQKRKGKTIIYFKKLHFDSIPGMGSVLLTNKNPQEIINPGNPGGFDYKQYSFFQGITHQVYLKPGDYSRISKEKYLYRELIYGCRDWVIKTLQKYIRGEKERGLSEALLIGYRDDLDRGLVKAYSNTGVVHVIAISGLHIGLIYWLLMIITKPASHKSWSWARVLMVLAGLWIFSLIAGGQPSVVRSTVMFSFLALGEVLQRRTNIFNSLAMSAFLLLSFNPYWLFDAGFQLSYAAVLGIVIFYRSIYAWLFFQNRIMDFFWKLSAVTIAAQILTLPISIYHFHQVPLLFLLTNIVAVPLSTIILFGEILLCLFSFIPQLAWITGMAVEWMILQMNLFIERLDAVSVAAWKNIYISSPQFFFLFVLIFMFCIWLKEKNISFLWISLFSLLGFNLAGSVLIIKKDYQKRMVIYQVPGVCAIDLINGREFYYHGAPLNEEQQQRYLLPSRLSQKASLIRNLKGNEFNFLNKEILIIDSGFKGERLKQNLDYLVIKGNPRISLKQLSGNSEIRQIVSDGRMPLWKSKQWKKECESAGIPFHDTRQMGAFVVEF